MEALQAALHGRSMTRTQAATCIQAFWRRYQTLVLTLTQQVAAQIIQRAGRHRMWQRYLLAEVAVERLQAAFVGMVERRELKRMRLAQTQHLAACTLQKEWRLHCVRRVQRAKRSRGIVRRSFSWSRKQQRAPPRTACDTPTAVFHLDLRLGHFGVTLGADAVWSTRAARTGVVVSAVHDACLCAQSGLRAGDVLFSLLDVERGVRTALTDRVDALAAMRACTGRVELEVLAAEQQRVDQQRTAPPQPTAVRRSLSFGAKPFGVGTKTLRSIPEQAGAAPRTEVFVLRAGVNGLGLELDATNSVQRITGAAEAQGLLRLQDTIVAVDGAPLHGRLLSHVMERGKSQYTVEVRRFSAVTTLEEMPRKVRRSSSFGRGIARARANLKAGMVTGVLWR